jgi:hypothetical protein
VLAKQRELALYQSGSYARMVLLGLHYRSRRAASIAATSIFFIPIIASNARFASPLHKFQRATRIRCSAILARSSYSRARSSKV